jgi:hypothetical protein
MEGGRERQSGRRVVMKRQIPTQVKNARRLSDAIIAKRYLELQRLHDEVRKAEASRAMDAPYSKDQATTTKLITTAAMALIVAEIVVAILACGLHVSTAQAATVTFSASGGGPVVSITPDER